MEYHRTNIVGNVIEIILDDDGTIGILLNDMPAMEILSLPFIPESMEVNT